MRQIAAEVGVQVGALYNYTPDKQSLLYDLMHTHLTDLLQTWRSQKTDTAPEELVLQFVITNCNTSSSGAVSVFCERQVCNKSVRCVCIKSYNKDCLSGV